MARTKEHLRGVRKPGRIVCRGPPPPPPPTERVRLLEGIISVSIWGWPSRGGLIVLERAGPIEFDHLGLDRFQLTLDRSSKQDEEDEFCQKLLHLGARWFDSRERYYFISDIADDDEAAFESIVRGEEPYPSKKECRWASVGIEEEGFWVLEYDQVFNGGIEKQNLLPGSACQICLARTMEEKCEMLKQMGATFYKSITDYHGSACINDWQTRVRGEFGPLVRTDALSSYT